MSASALRAAGSTRPARVLELRDMTKPTVLHLIRSRSLAAPETLCERLALGFAQRGSNNLIAAFIPGDEPVSPELERFAMVVLLPTGFMNLLRESQILTRERNIQAAILYTFELHLVFMLGLFAAGVCPIVAVLRSVPVSRSARLLWKLRLRFLNFLRVVFVAETPMVAQAAGVACADIRGADLESAVSKLVAGAP